MQSSLIIRPARALASASVACCYAAYRLHDRRDLSNKEMEDAYHILAQLVPQRSVSRSQECKNEEPCSQHLSNLNQYGVSIVKETLSPAQIAQWNTTTNEAFANTSNNIVWNSGRAHYSISKRTSPSLFSEMARIGRSSCSKNDDQDAAAAASSGRGIYFWKREKPKSNTQTLPHQTEAATLQDIVKSYFKQHKIERYELTDVQFLNAYPESTNQIWHRDNTCCGLTAIVALNDVRSNGPTELLACTHQKDFSLWKALHNAVFESNNAAPFSLGQPLLGVLDAGDAILYDARIFHRGRGYRESSDSGHDRPVLVLRWDAANTPPPGAGLIKTTANTYVGCFLYAALSAVQKFRSKTDVARRHSSA